MLRMLHHVLLPAPPKLTEHQTPFTVHHAPKLSSTSEATEHRNTDHHEPVAAAAQRADQSDDEELLSKLPLAIPPSTKIAFDKRSYRAPNTDPPPSTVGDIRQ
jgi:hypothetical protein